MENTLLTNLAKATSSPTPQKQKKNPKKNSRAASLPLIPRQITPRISPSLLVNRRRRHHYTLPTRLSIPHFHTRTSPRGGKFRARVRITRTPRSRNRQRRRPRTPARADHAHQEHKHRSDSDGDTDGPNDWEARGGGGGGDGDGCGGGAGGCGLSGAVQGAGCSWGQWEDEEVGAGEAERLRRVGCEGDCGIYGAEAVCGLCRDGGDCPAVVEGFAGDVFWVNGWLVW